MSASPDPNSEVASPSLPGFLFDPIGLAHRRWKWMLGALLFGLGSTGLFARTLDLTYLASATVLVTSQRISEEFFRPTVESDQLEKVSAILGELMSRQNLVELIERHSLYPNVAGKKPISIEDKVDLFRQTTIIEPDTSWPFSS